MNLLKQLQMTQMLNNMQKNQQMENNLSMPNNFNLNNSSQDFKSLPFKDSAIMAVKMSNNNANLENPNQFPNGMNSMNIFQNLNMKTNDMPNNTNIPLNPVSPMNSFANLNQLNQMNRIQNMSQLNGMNSMNNFNSLHNFNPMNGFGDIATMNMNMTSNSLTSPTSVSMNMQNFKSMNGLDKESIGGLTTSMNTPYDDEKMNFFQKLSELNSDEREKDLNMNQLPDFWKAKIQDTGGGNNEEGSNLLVNSILEQRFNEAEQMSLMHNKVFQINNEVSLNTPLESDLSSLNVTNEENNQINEPSKKVLPQNNDSSTNKTNAKNEILDILTRKASYDDKKSNVIESEKVLKIKENDILNVKENFNENINDKNVTLVENKNKQMKEFIDIQEKENINNNIAINNNSVQTKKKDKKDSQK